MRSSIPSPRSIPSCARPPAARGAAALAMAALALGAWSCAPADGPDAARESDGAAGNAEVEAAYGRDAMPPGAASPDEGAEVGAEEGAAAGDPADVEDGAGGAEQPAGDDESYQAALDAYDEAASADVPEAPPSAFGDDFSTLMWDDMYRLDLETGEAPPELASLDGQPVAIPGFMVPLEDFQAQVSEFLFVPYAQACIHVPAPPANQIVHVTMVDGATAEYSAWDPVWLYGLLHIEDREHLYGSASYVMDGYEVKPYVFGQG